MHPNQRKLICALDTPDLGEAIATVKRLHGFVGAFKIGHALTLPNGLQVVETLQDAGADRIFLDLKFHDIPNSVALAVREAARHGVWMMTLHISGGPAMLSASVEQARAFAEESAPLLVGVSVLTSLDERTLTEDLAVNRSLEEQVVSLSALAMDQGLDGVVCSAHEVAAVRQKLGKHAVLVCPGIRPASSESHDQKRVGQATQALEDGADYLVIGRALAGIEDPHEAIASLGLPL